MIRLSNYDHQLLEQRPEIRKVHHNHNRLSINISMDFNPGVEDLGSYLIRKAEELKSMGEKFRVEDEKWNMEDQAGDHPKIHLLPGWEESGEY